MTKTAVFQSAASVVEVRDVDCHWAPIVGFSEASPSAILQVHCHILGLVLPKVIVIARARVFFPLYSRMKTGVETFNQCRNNLRA